MLQLRIGLQLSSLRQPLKKALETASRLGADAVEIDVRNELPMKDMSRTAIRHFRKLLDDLNLKIAALSFPTRRGFDTDAQLDERVDATMKAMSLAYDLGATVVTNQVGMVPESSEESRPWSNLVESLTTIGKHGQRCGAMFAARTGTESGEDLFRLIEALPSGSIGVDFDPGELTIHRFSPSDAIQKLAPYVMHVRARDGVQDLAQGRGIEVQLGRGSVDFLAILGNLENYNYTGFFTLERRHAKDPIVEINQGMEYLRNLWA